MISSCTLYSGEDYLVGQIYVNEETLDKIEFAEKGKIVFVWTSDEKPYWRKDQPYEYYYHLTNNEIHVGGFQSSAEAFHFLCCKRLEFSDSKEEIFFTEKRSDRSGVFKRVK